MKQAFSSRARGARYLAYSILVIICVLLGGAATVFLLPQQFSPTGAIDPAAVRENIDAKTSDIRNRIRERLPDLRSNRSALADILSSQSDQKLYTAFDGHALRIEFRSYPDYGGRLTILDLINKITANNKVIDQAIEFSLVEVNDDLSNRTSSSTYRIPFNSLTETISQITARDFKEMRQDELSAIRLALTQLDALDSVKSIVDSQLREQQASQLLGTKISFFGNLATNQQGGDWLAIVEPNITRFGTMIIVSFLVGILSPLYRYNIRIASFYEARADALEFLKTSLRSNGYIRLCSSLTPTLDFGKQPQTPVEQIIELARTLASRETHGTHSD